MTLRSTEQLFWLCFHGISIALVLVAEWWNACTGTPRRSNRLSSGLSGFKTFHLPHSSIDIRTVPMWSLILVLSRPYLAQCLNWEMLCPTQYSSAASLDNRKVFFA